YDVSKYIHELVSDTATSNHPPLTPKELKVDKIVLSWIFSALSDTLQQRLVVARLKSAMEAWDFIVDIVKDNKRSRTSSLKVELRSITLGDLSMDAYFGKIESLMTILASLDSLVNDEDVVHYVLEGLPDKYNQVCGYMHYKDIFSNLKTARSLLITEEMRLKCKDLALPVDFSSPMVLMAKSCNTRRSLPTTQVKSWRPCFNFAKGACGSVICVVMCMMLMHGWEPSTPTRLSSSPRSPTHYYLSSTHWFVLYAAGPSTTCHHNVRPTALSSQPTTIPHAFNTETLQDLNSGAWNIDTCASSHLNASSTCLSNGFNTCLYSSVSVGDGHPIPVTNTGHSVLPTPHGSLHLNNVLITPNIVRNLNYVRQFIRDNNCTIEFDAFVFSVKDFTTRRVLFRCDNTRDLYLVTSPSPIPQAYLDVADFKRIWNLLHGDDIRITKRHQSIERFLNNFAKQPNETNMNDLESDGESVDTPLVSPFPHSDNDSDDSEVLNELIEYANIGMLRREKAINSFDGDDLAFQCMIRFRKFVAYFDPFLPMNIITRKAYNTIIVEGLESTWKNLVAVVRDVYVFAGNFTYITDFVVLEDIGEFILIDKAEVVMGKPFRKITKLEYYCSKGLMPLNRIFDNYTFHMPHYT
nr:ribonuclease H-like domain-containing protein [Tanacetum cinerariifolium]